MEREKKECILSAAVRSFARFGFKKASVEDIAKEAGVAKGTVYLACESKEDLYYQAVHRELRAWIAEVSKMIDPRVPADELLQTVSAASIKYLDDRPLVRELLFGGTRTILPDWVERLEELRTLGLANVVEILKLGIKQGRFRKDLDVDEVATLLHDLQFATYVFHSADVERHSERLARRALAGYDLILHGLMAE
jgi:AcrR family transcriptional regulator